MCDSVVGLPELPRGGGAAMIGPWLPVTHTVSPSHLPSPSHTQPPLSHRQSHGHTQPHRRPFSRTQGCTVAPSASNTACHTLSPRCRPQKCRHSLSDAGHACLQPRRLTPPHTDPDTLTPTLCQHHGDQQGRTCMLGPGAPAAVLATWPHRVTALLGHKEGKPI